MTRIVGRLATWEETQRGSVIVHEGELWSILGMAPDLEEPGYFLFRIRNAANMQRDSLLRHISQPVFIVNMEES